MTLLEKVLRIEIDHCRAIEIVIAKPDVPASENRPERWAGRKPRSALTKENPFYDNCQKWSTELVDWRPNR